MFIGHFAVGLAAKKAAPKLNLAVLFISCQLLDLIWPVLVLMGIEFVSVDHSATVVTPFNFSHYPYSHSLVMTLVYGLVLGAIVLKVFKSKTAAITSVAVVVSHWVLDFITHRPDLPLLLTGQKFGLGMWNSLAATVIVEVGIFAIGIFLYLKASPLITRKRRIIFWSMISFLVVVYIGNIWGPKAPMNTPPEAIAGPALSMWLIDLWAYFSDKREK